MMAAVYVLWAGSPNARASDVNVRGVYADASAAAAARSALIAKGVPAKLSRVMVLTLGKIGAGGEVWLWNRAGSARFTAFGDMDAADARRRALGGQVRAYQVIGGAGAGKVMGAATLRKKAAALSSHLEFRNRQAIALLENAATPLEKAAAGARGSI